MAISRAQRRRQLQAISAAFSFPFNVDKYLDIAIRTFPQDPTSYAYALILNSPEFRKRFPGIKKPDGTLRISVSEYLNREEWMKSTAARYNFALTRTQIGVAIANNIDQNTWETLAQAVQWVQQNPDHIAALQQQIALFNRERRRLGMKGIPQVRTAADAVNFAAGRSDREVYNLWEGAMVAQNFRDAGVNVSTRDALRVARRTPGVNAEDIMRKGLELAAQIRLAGPELFKELSPQDLLVLEFGGRDQSDIVAKAERILTQRKAQVSSTLQGPSTALTTRGRPVVQTPPQEASF